MMQNQISVLIRSREKVLFQGEVKAISSLNEKGPFDILFKHANFISLIKDKIIVHKPGGGNILFPIKIGVLNVQANQVRIYLDILSSINI